MPSALETTVQQEYTSAMKARDASRVAALRLLMTEIKNAKIAKRSDLTDDDVLAVVKREVKKRKEAAEAFRSGNRVAQAAAEEAELAVLQAYLPQQLTGEELNSLVEKILKKEPTAGPADFGAVMKKVMSEAGNRVDGSAVAAAVRSRLSSRAS